MAQQGLEPDPARGQRLKELKDERDLTQKEVADATGLSAGGLRVWEGGGRMGLSTLQKLARYYGVNASWIRTGHGTKEEIGADFLERLTSLEQEVKAQGDRFEALVTALREDQRWETVEHRLNFLSERLRRVSEAAQAEAEQDESRQWSPIDLSPGEPTP